MTQGNGDYYGEISRVAQQAARETVQEMTANTAAAVRTTLAEVRQTRRENRETRAEIARVSSDIADLTVAFLKNAAQDAAQDTRIAEAEARQQEAKKAYEAAKERIETTGNIPLALLQRQQSDAEIVKRVVSESLTRKRDFRRAALKLAVYAGVLALGIFFGALKGCFLK